MFNSNTKLRLIHKTKNKKFQNFFFSLRRVKKLTKKSKCKEVFVGFGVSRPFDTKLYTVHIATSIAPK